MTDDKIIKDAQYRKGLSIGFFNATNAAIALVAAILGKEQLNMNDESIIERVAKIRNIFIEQHKEYYATVIAQVGSSYDAAAVIKKLKSFKKLEDLQIYWVSITADERKDGEIRKVAGEMKTKLS